MHKQSGTRAGSHQRHTRKINISPPMRANNATRAANGDPPTRHLYMPMHLTRTSLRTLCHKGTSHRHGSTTPTAGTTVNRAAHTTETKALGLPPCARKQAQTPQSPSGRDEQNKTNGVWDVPNPEHNQTHARTHIYIHTNRPRRLRRRDVMQRQSETRAGVHSARTQANYTLNGYTVGSMQVQMQRSKYRCIETGFHVKR